MKKPIFISILVFLLLISLEINIFQYVSSRESPMISWGRTARAMGKVKKMNT